jgi:hypothetical protein
VPGFDISYLSAEERQHRLANLGAVSAHLAPLLDALAAGVTVMTLPPIRQAFAMPAHLKHKAWLAVLCDDNQVAAGPAGYHLKSLRRLLAETDIVSIMVGTPMKVAYRAAADIAIGHEQLTLGAGMCVAVIETQEPERASWQNFVDRHAPQASKVVTAPDAQRTNRAAAWAAYSARWRDGRPRFKPLM